MRLNELQPGESAVVLSVDAKGPIRKRLLEMGFVRGTVLRIERFAPLGDPMELVIRDFHLSIRLEEGACICVKPVTP